MAGQEGPPPFSIVKNAMNKIGFREQDRDISVNALVFFYSDNTFGVVHDTDIQVKNPKKDGEDYPSGVAKYENESYSVAFITKGSNEEQLFKLADTIDKEFRKRKKQTPKEPKRKPIKRKILDEFETDNEEVIIHSASNLKTKDLKVQATEKQSKKAEIKPPSKKMSLKQTKSTSRVDSAAQSAREIISRMLPYKSLNQETVHLTSVHDLNVTSNEFPVQLDSCTPSQISNRISQSPSHLSIFSNSQIQVPPPANTVINSSSQGPPHVNTINNNTTEAPPHVNTIANNPFQAPPNVNNNTTQAPPHDNTVMNSPSQAPPHVSNVINHTTQAPPHVNIVNNMTQSQPHINTVINNTTQAPPHVNTVINNTTQAPPHANTVINNTTQAPPHVNTVINNTTQAPPHANTVISNTTQAPLHVNTVINNTTQAPLYVNTVNNMTQAQPHTNTVNNNTTQAPPHVNAVINNTIQAPPYVNTVINSPSQAPPHVSTVNNTTQAPPHVNIVNNNTTQAPPHVSTVNNTTPAPPHVNTVINNPTQAPPYFNTVINSPSQAPPHVSTVNNTTQAPPHVSTVNSTTQAPSHVNIVNNNTTQSQPHGNTVNNMTPAQPHINTVNNNTTQAPPHVNTVINNTTRAPPHVDNNTTWAPPQVNNSPSQSPPHFSTVNNTQPLYINSYNTYKPITPGKHLTQLSATPTTSAFLHMHKFDADCNLSNGDFWESYQSSNCNVGSSTSLSFTADLTNTALGCLNPTERSTSTFTLTPVKECGNCELLTQQNEFLQLENKKLKSDIFHLQQKYQQAVVDQQSMSSLYITQKENEMPVYTPKRGMKVQKASYEIKSVGVGVPPGYSRFGGANSKIVVPDSWLLKMNTSTKKKQSSCAVKKYIDAFFSPWDMQALNSTVIDIPGPTKDIFEALEAFASERYNFSKTEFNKIVNSKAGTARRTMKQNFPEQAISKCKPRKKIDDCVQEGENSVDE